MSVEVDKTVIWVKKRYGNLMERLAQYEVLVTRWMDSRTVCLNRYHSDYWTDVNATEEFAFCESMGATSTSPWHIRQLTDKGLKLGGGADTEALCGREMCWDLNVTITEHHLSHCCKKCCVQFNGVSQYDKGKDQSGKTR